MVDYSRFDGIGEGDSSSDEGVSPAPARVSGPAMQLGGGPPAPIMDDLEDYFRRLDERRSGLEGDAQTAASVDRFTPAEMDLLLAVPYQTDCGYGECAICLADFAVGDECLQMPCAASHVYHAACIRACLERSVFCPLCRVDLKAILPAADRASASTIDTALPSPRQLGWTRDGGRILRYEPSPSAELLRPHYIPTALHGVASLVEVEYPDSPSSGRQGGVARIWRVPRESAAVPLGP